jgi:hypothetical protein
VHATLEYDLLLHPNGVRDILAQVTATKHIFTNADAKHTAECLSRLGIQGCFEVSGHVVGTRVSSDNGRGGRAWLCLGWML